MSDTMHFNLDQKVVSFNTGSIISSLLSYQVISLPALFQLETQGPSPPQSDPPYLETVWTKISHEQNLVINIFYSYFY